MEEVPKCTGSTDNLNIPKDNDSFNMMSFNSPGSCMSGVLVPQKMQLGVSPLLLSVTQNIASPSSDPPQSPVQSSTPFLPVGNETKKQFNFDKIDGMSSKDSYDPFEFMEQKAQDCNDPFECVSAEAAKKLELTVTDCDQTVVSNDSLNKGFLEGSSNDKSSSSKDNKSTGSSDSNNPTAMPPPAIPEEECLDSECPPWEQQGARHWDSDPEEEEEDLVDLLRRLSAEFHSSLAVVPLEPLSDQSVRGLGLRSPAPLFSLNITPDLMLQSPPLSLRISELSSPLTAGPPAFSPPASSTVARQSPPPVAEPAEKIKEQQPGKQKQFSAEHKVLQLPALSVAAKPLAVVNAPVSRLPRKLQLVSRLQQPRVHTNKENL